MDNLFEMRFTIKIVESAMFINDCDYLRSTQIFRVVFVNKTFNINRYSLTGFIMNENSIPMNFVTVFNGHRFTIFSKSTPHDVTLSKEN